MLPDEAHAAVLTSGRTPTPPCPGRAEAPGTMPSRVPDELAHAGGSPATSSGGEAPRPPRDSGRARVAAPVLAATPPRTRSAHRHRYRRSGRADQHAPGPA